MNNKLIFAIVVAVSAIILLVTKIITFEYVMENSLAIGAALTAVWLWLSKVEVIKKNKKLEVANTLLAAENGTLTARKIRKVEKS